MWSQVKPDWRSHRLSLVIFRYEVLEFLSQVAVLLAQFVVSAAVLLDLGLDVVSVLWKCVVISLRFRSSSRHPL